MECIQRSVKLQYQQGGKRETVVSEDVKEL